MEIKTAGDLLAASARGVGIVKKKKEKKKEKRLWIGEAAKAFNTTLIHFIMAQLYIDSPLDIYADNATTYKGNLCKGLSLFWDINMADVTPFENAL